MPQPLRRAFHRDLDTIDEKVIELFALVTEGLAAATDTFLAGDRDGAQTIADRDKLIDSLEDDVEALVQRQLILQAPVAGELRFLLSVVRIVPELERSGDLAEHIATRATRGLGTKLSPQVRGIIQQMGHVGVDMWRRAADAYADRDASAADRLNRLDDRLDDLHTQLMTELAAGTHSVPISMEMALVARFYERLGDHAVHIAERIRYAALG